MANIYRKAALDKISSPDQLDQAITISSPLSWLVVAAVGLIIAVTIVWACVTDVQQTVDVTIINTKYYSISSSDQVASGSADKKDVLLCLVPAQYDISPASGSSGRNNVCSIQVKGKRIGSIPKPDENSPYQVLTDTEITQIVGEYGGSLGSSFANQREFVVMLDPNEDINTIPPYCVAQLVVGTKRPIEYVNEFFKRGD